MTSKVVFIGLDGATFEVIDPLIAAGRLPHIAALIARGVRASLTSTIPICSWSAWPSMMTGVYQGKHSLYHCRYFDGYTERVIASHQVRAEALWQTVSAASRRVCVLGMPVTYPPAPVNGVMISGVPMPHGLHIHPSPMAAEIARLAPGYPIHRDWERVLRLRGHRGLLREFERSLRLSLRVALDLWPREAWDAFLVVFCELDRIQHLVPWPEVADAPDAGARRELLTQCYALADEAVGALLAAVGDDATVVLASDHGFGERRGVFHLNRWLADHGWLAVKPGALRPWRVTRRTVDDLAGAVGLDIGGVFGSIPLWIPRRVRAHPLEVIAWEGTQAFAANADLDGIYVNLRGRQPGGTVEPGAAYEDLREALIAGLGEVKDPQTGAPVVSWARRREDMFSGPYVADAPDVVFMTADNSYAESGRLDVSDAIVRLAPGSRGSHRLEGILTIAGPMMRSGIRLADCRIVDVAPTLLHLLGLPVNAEADGRVLTEAWDERALAARPVRTRAAEIAATAADGALTQADEDEMERQLRGLGYM